MLLAVLEKRCGLAYGQHDVFLNLAGGLKITDPALDLAVVASLISSRQDISLSDEIAFIGEVGLSGEVRSVSRIEQRLQEAARLGRSQIYISKYSLKGIDTTKYDANIVGVSKVDDLLREVFA
jgi:DNA repair protein RadA/Sms